MPVFQAKSWGIPGDNLRNLFAFSSFMTNFTELNSSCYFKMKLKHILLSMAATVVAIVGCEKTQDLGPAEVTVVSPSETTINVPIEGTEFTVTLKATIDWALQGYTEDVASWLSVSPASGAASSENQTITVKVLANDGADRKADLVFYGNVLCKAALTVSQKGNGAAVGGEVITVADFISKADTQTEYVLHGTISDVTKNASGSYWGFVLKDETGEISCPFVENWDEFALKNGDVVSIKGKYSYYEKKSQHQLANGTIISHEAGQGGGGSTDPEAIYSADFTASMCNFTIDDKNKPSEVEAVWSQNSQYGMVATAYVNSTNYAAESWLVSPVIDLASESKAFLTFEHAVNFFKDLETVKTEAVVYARVENGEWAELNGVKYPSRMSWTYASAGYLDLSAYAGKKMQIAFVYKSTEEKAGTWEIKNVSIVKESKESVEPEIPDGAITWEINNEVQTWDKISDETYGEGYSATVDGITVGFYKYNSTSGLKEPSTDQIRIYKNAAFKISSEKTLKEVILYSTESKYCVGLTSLEGDANGFTADTGSLTVKWTGSAKEIVAAATIAQVRVTKIVFVCE